MILVLVLSQITRGTARWIKIGNLFTIQPSQLAIPIVALTLANFVNKYKLSKLKNILRFLILLFLPAILILVAPDLGTTLVYLGSLGIILFLNLNYKYILLLLCLGFIGLILAWGFILQDYQKSRITDFINPQSKNNYNARQALIAVGSGQAIGKGLGHGSQSHLRFLPERQTDFIFASYAEEWGFVGTTLLLLIYFLLIIYLFYFSFKFKLKTKIYYLFVISFMLAIQSMINIGMNIGLLPITGLTLPLLSYGGSSLISICMSLGICQNIIFSYQKKVNLEIA